MANNQPITPKPSAVILDWDFTLVKRGNAHLFRGGDGDVKHAVKAAVVATTGELGSAALSGAREDVEDKIRALNPPRLRSGARQFILSLIMNDIPVFIVSNGSNKHIQSEVRECLGDAIASRIHVCGKQKTAPRKPEPEAFEAPLKEYGITPNTHVWVIGDSFRNDLAPALALGLTPMLLKDNKRDETHVDHHNAKNPEACVRKIKSFQELKEILAPHLSSPTINARE